MGRSVGPTGFSGSRAVGPTVFTYSEMERLAYLLHGQTITQILFQKWISENYKFSFRIVDFYFIFDHPHSNIRNTHV